MTDDTELNTIQTKDEVAREIEEWVDDARDLAKEVGLDPYEVKYWIVDNEEMNRLATYGGFQHRYPHWRYGMQYDRQSKQSQYTGSRIFELVNNDNPSHAFLQRSNSIADQKSVVTHVEAHADFFKNNRWFEDDPNSAQRLEEHADRIEEIMDRPDVDRSDVESLIDTITCIEDTIDQHRIEESGSVVTDDDGTSIEEYVEQMDVDDSIKEHVFDEEWMERVDDDDGRIFYDDVVEFIVMNGQRYDEDEGKAVEFEDWERDVIEIMHDEAMYFAPQKMTKVMNEGWAAFWESVMMTDEQFASENEFVEYADHMSKILEAPGTNPYKLGLEIYTHIENEANKREVIDKLLRIEGVTPGNFHRTIDFDRVESVLDNPDSYSPSMRNFSLVRPQNRGVIRSVSTEELLEVHRYMIDDERYETVDGALDDVDYSAGWDRIFEVRETHVDPTFIDEFVTADFIEENDYFTYDYNKSDEQWQVSSTDSEDVKRKLLLDYSNFGKPTISVEDDNYNNAGELLLTHRYNGISLDTKQARRVLERLFDVWGRPVNLRTVVKYEGEEKGFELRYDEDGHDDRELDDEEYEYLIPEEIDYDTKPEGWS